MRKPDWQSDCGRYRLYCGDCLDILPELEQVDAVVTDPPYMIGAKSDGSGKINPWSDWSNAAIFMTAWMRECKRLSRATWSCLNWRSLVTFQKAACDLAWPIESLMVWDKCWIGPGGTNGLRPSYEMVAFWSQGASIKNRGLPDIQKFPWSSHKPNGHPAEKPVPLMRFCMEAVGASSVLDPFMGSGTTGVAAVQSGRSFVGIEQDESHFATAVRRIREALGEEVEGTDGFVQRKMFVSTCVEISE